MNDALDTNVHVATHPLATRMLATRKFHPAEKINALATLHASLVCLHSSCRYLHDPRQPRDFTYARSTWTATLPLHPFMPFTASVALDDILAGEISSHIITSEVEALIVRKLQVACCRESSDICGIRSPTPKCYHFIVTSISHDVQIINTADRT